MFNMKFNKNMLVIWIGPNPAPMNWIKTWQEKHPSWDFRIVGNDELYGRTWRNQSLIDVYLKENRYPGVADVMRYELMYEEGAFVAPADSICLHPVDELLTDCDALAVYENEKVRPGLVSPLYACTPHNAFAKVLVDNLPDTPPLAKNGTTERPSKAPWLVTGNLFMQQMIAKHKTPGLKIVPSYTFNPIHHTGETYKGTGKVYAKQMWGTTHNTY